MEKAALSTQDKDRARDFLKLNNAVEFMSSEESDEDRGQTSGPSARDVKPLRWERSKLRNIKAVLDATYKARMSNRQQRTAAKVTRVASQNMSSRPLPQTYPFWVKSLLSYYLFSFFHFIVLLTLQHTVFFFNSNFCWHIEAE